MAAENKSTVIPDQSTLVMPKDEENAEKAPRVISSAETAAYLTALLVNIVDQMGPQFVSPVLVTYGQEIGADGNTLGWFQTARGLSAMMSNIWMPMLSDRCGRKWVAFLSVCGVSAGYLTQALADNFTSSPPVPWNPACIVFIIGRFITGFFSGMQPVLQAYISELSAPEADLITQRLVVVQVAANVGGIAVSPLSGVLAKSFGLQAPFFAVTVIGVISMFIVPIYFKEVKDIRTDLAVDPSAVSMQPRKRPSSDPATDPFVAEAAAEEATGGSEGNPFADVVIMLMFVAYVCLMVMVNGITVFLTPILFQQEEFHISGGPWEEYNGTFPNTTAGNEAKEDFRNNVSLNISIANIPIGLLQVVVAIALFLPVTKKFGEVPTLMVMGLIGTICFPIVGYCKAVWQVVIVFAVLGMCFGFLTPALGPVSARYGRAMYPSQLALVQGIPLVGMQLSNAFAQLMLAQIVGADLEALDILGRIQTAYFVVAGFAGLFTITFAAAASLSTKRINAMRLNGSMVEDEEDDGDSGLGASVLQRHISDSRHGVPIGTPLLKRAISGARGVPRSNPGSQSNVASVISMRDSMRDDAQTGS